MYTQQPYERERKYNDLDQFHNKFEIKGEGRVVNFIFHFVLTANATSWMIVIYGINKQWNFWIFSTWMTGVILLFIPILLSLFSIALTLFLGHDSMNNCEECDLADHDFLSIYLGYFFIALSIENTTTLCFIYAIIFLFTFLTKNQYFNPIFLLFGYHFYNIITAQGTRVFVIVKGAVIRNTKDMKFTELRRINDTTYITRKEQVR